MRRYLDLSTWVILFALLPVTILILLSQNTVPGDLFYPVKRGLESVILVAASVNPSTKVAFRTGLTERRFKEAEQLLVLQADTKPLTDLVGEVEIAKAELFKLSSFEEKKELSEKLIEKIEQYETKLAVVQTQIEQQPVAQPFQAPPPAGGPSQAQPVQTPVPVGQTPAPFQPTPAPTLATPQPTSTPFQPTAQTPVPIPSSPPATEKPLIQIPFQAKETPAPTPVPILDTAKKEEVVTDVKDTRKKLKDFKEHIQREREDDEAKKKFREQQERFRKGEGEGNGRNEDD